MVMESAAQQSGKLKVKSSVSPAGGELDVSLCFPELLHHLFERRADAAPEAIAVEFESERVSYAQLEARANQLAQLLHARGIKRGELVGMLAPRGVEAYVAILGILKSGAGYLPIDTAYPLDRIAFICEDAAARIVVSIKACAAQLPAGVEAVLLDGPVLDGLSPTRLPARRDLGAAWEDTAYAIYTSGTTGRPKGVPISHRAVCNLVRAESRIFEVKPNDRVYQGFSLAFDASVEEVWAAFFAGATLVAAPDAVVKAAGDLGAFLSGRGITVLSTVPTLLTLMDGDVPSVRLLIVGGEACPAHLVERWARPGRRLLNTYGPTEATVIATWKELRPGEPVTIGKAVANYATYVVDEKLERVAPGVSGELLLGGVGVARGYLNRPELTREKFVENRFADRDVVPTLYRTGDLVRENAAGDLEFLGRIDSQVKLRGYRIELAEIEASLCQEAAVQAAVCTVREDVAGMPRLVGYVILRADARLDEVQLKAALRTRLPPFMVPELLEPIGAFPTLPSGKVDRKRLPAPAPRSASATSPLDPPQTPTELQLAQLLGKIFPGAAISRSSDFFADLGGHSLLAAALVSELRRSDVGHASMLDVYHHPVLSKLAAHLDQHKVGSTVEVRRMPNTAPVSSARYHAFCAAQLLALYPVFALYSLQWLLPFVTFGILDGLGVGGALAVGGALLSIVASYPVMLLLALATKWLVIGRYREGKFPLWGAYHFRLWLVDQLLDQVPLDYLEGTPLLPAVYRLLGAKIGKGAHLAADSLGAFDLITIGAGASVGPEASLLTCLAGDGYLRLAKVEIGPGAVVGTRAIIGQNASVGAGAKLGDLSYLQHGERQPAGEEWHGSPAKHVAFRPAPADPTWRPRPTPFAKVALYAVLAIILPLFVVAAAFPGTALMHEAALQWGRSYLLLSPVVAVSFVLLLAGEIVALKWLVLGRVKAGSYPLHGSFYMRKWFVDQLMDTSLDVLGSIYATVFLPPWFRMLGVKLGKDAEVSTANHTSPDLLELGAGCFIADGVSLGAPEIEAGQMVLKHTRVGERTFVGNSAVVPGGAILGDESLIGVLSTPPMSAFGATPAKTSWLGSPAMFLPSRATSAASFGAESTYKPSRKMRIARVCFDFARVTMPATTYVLVTSVLVELLALTRHRLGSALAFAAFPLVYFGVAALAALGVVAAKWILIGTYRPGEKPLWNGFVWRNELVTALHENVANPLLIAPIMGTPLVALFFRMMGSKIGKRVYLETTQFTEYDLISIGDDACINDDCTLQTHLFEDRVMKMSTVSIGANCNVGAGAVVLYDTQMLPGSSLGPVSLLMKGESLPAGTAWEGCPARREQLVVIPPSRPRKLSRAA
jgi:non-ribosomal peptide synthetase-like protein